jgi:hypothetical protein
MFSVVAYSAKDFLKSTKWQLSGLNHPNFGFFVLVPKSPIHTGLIYVKNPKPNISSLGPFKHGPTGMVKHTITVYPSTSKPSHFLYHNDPVTGIYDIL